MARWSGVALKSRHIYTFTSSFLVCWSARQQCKKTSLSKKQKKTTVLLNGTLLKVSYYV